MGCGCGKNTAPSIPLTSGDLAAVAPGMPRFKVVRDDGAEEEFATYREARMAQTQRGGKLRAV